MLSVLWMGWTCSKAGAAMILLLLLACASQLYTSTKSSGGCGETVFLVAAVAFECGLCFLALERCVVESARLARLGERTGSSECVAGHHTVFSAAALVLAFLGACFKRVVWKEAFIKTENMSLGAALNNRKGFRMRSCIGGE